MGTLIDVVHWLTNGAHWQGTDGIPTLLGQTTAISIVSLATGIIIAAPIGLWLGHIGRGGSVAINVANAGRAIPAFGLLVLFVLWLGGGDSPTVLARLGVNSLATYLVLVVLAIPPIFLNTYIGMRQLDAEILEAGRGMGMTGWGMLTRLEFPLALPTIFAGIRTSSINVIATATLAAFVGAGGLGDLIVEGRSLQDNVELYAGAVLVGLLAMTGELLFATLERRCVSRGIRR
jgi:osmoprotectant transport system permease protein